MGNATIMKTISARLPEELPPMDRLTTGSHQPRNQTSVEYVVRSLDGDQPNALRIYNCRRDRIHRRHGQRRLDEIVCEIEDQ